MLLVILVLLISRKTNFTPTLKFITFSKEPAHIEEADHNIDFSTPFFLTNWI